ncbi:MAG: type II toxin-antitoxin system VapC family toxin [Acidobacteriota bacterium]
MNAVVDTNVVAYLLLGSEPFVEEARTALEAVTTPLAPAHWEAELTNVVWMAVRSGVLPSTDAPNRLSLARRLGIESMAIGTLCQGALLRSTATGLAVYDTLFVELAVRAKCPLITFDKAVLRTFPDIAIRPRELADG